MSVSTTGARHRAARRPTTVFSSLGQNLAGHTARRGMLAAASSSLAITMAATTASAAPDSASSALPQVDVASLTAEARTALSTSPSVVVPDDATWTLDDEADAQATPAPEPEPEPEPEPAAAAAPAVDRSAPAASRTNTRTEVTQTEEAAPAQAETQSAAPAPAASGSAIVDIAYRYIGTPYVWGGATPGGFDCSGFTSYVYAQAGISIPRSSSAQRSAGTQVSASAAQPGDLVWWPGHVGIYVGGGQYIAAHSPGTPLSVRAMYKPNPVFIRVG